MPDERGQSGSLSPRLVQVANKARVKLIKEAGNDNLVTWEDVHKATKKALRSQGFLTKGVRVPRIDWLARLLREKSAVRARPGKRRVSHTKEHETKRYQQARLCALRA